MLDLSSNVRKTAKFQLLTDEQYEKFTPTMNAPIMNFHNCNVTMGETKQKYVKEKKRERLRIMSSPSSDSTN